MSARPPPATSCAPSFFAVSMKEGAQLVAGGGRAFLLRRLDVTQIRFELLLRRDRAETRFGIQRIARRHLLRTRGDLVDELVLDRFVDEKPRSGCADFAFAIEDARRRAADRGVEIGIGKDDVRRLAAELEG